MLFSHFINGGSQMKFKMLLLSIGSVFSTLTIVQTVQIIRDTIPDFLISTSLIVIA